MSLLQPEFQIRPITRARIPRYCVICVDVSEAIVFGKSHCFALPENCHCWVEMFDNQLHFIQVARVEDADSLTADSFTGGEQRGLWNAGFLADSDPAWNERATSALGHERKFVDAVAVPAAI